MEITNIDELKNLIREVVKEELASKGSSTNQDQNHDQIEERNASHQQLDEVRNRIQQIGQSDIVDEVPRSIPSTPLSPGNQSTGQPTETTKTDNSHEVNKIREQIKAIPSTPLSPGVNPSQQIQSDSINNQPKVVDMEI